MDNKIIEKKGINSVSEYICDCGYLEEHLNSNDKTLLWDGTISVFSEKDELNIDNFRYEVKCQIKASEWENKNFPKSIIYEIKLRDLQKYYIDGGVVFFKSLVARNQQSQVYCAVLTKLTLSNILANPKGKKYTKLDLFPVPNHTEFLQQVESLHLQATHVLITPEQLKNKNFTFRIASSYINNTGHPFSILFSSLNDILVSIEGVPGEFYLEAPTRLHIGRTFKHEIKVGEVTHFNSLNVEFVEQGIKVSIGKSTVLIFPHKFSEEEGSATISYNFSASSIEEAENELKFLIDAFENSYFFIDALKISIGNFNKHLVREQIDGWRDMLSFVKEIKTLFQNLGVVDELNFDVLTEAEAESLEKIIYGILHECVLEINPEHDKKEDFVDVVNFAGVNLFIFFKHLSDGGYRIYDINKYLEFPFLTKSGKTAKQPVLSVLLEREDQLPSNLGVETALEQYKDLLKVDDFLVTMLNHDIERLLYHYDTYGKEVYLILAFSILQILLDCNFSDNEDNIYVRLLAIQMYKRRNHCLLDCHKEFLYELETDMRSPLNRFTAAVLLDDKSKADWVLKKMGQEISDILSKLPIYHLYKKLQ